MMFLNLCGCLVWIHKGSGEFRKFSGVWMESKGFWFLHMPQISQLRGLSSQVRSKAKPIGFAFASPMFEFVKKAVKESIHICNPFCRNCQSPKFTIAMIADMGRSSHLREILCICEVRNCKPQVTNTTSATGQIVEGWDF